jgi:Trypsin-co-occurring domain 1
MTKTEMIPVQLENGVTVYMEVTPKIDQTRLINLDPERDVADEETEFDVADFAGFKVESLTSIIELFGKQLSKSIQAVGPNKASIEFGLEATFKQGQLVALITQGEAKANLKVKLEWQK